MGPHRRLVGGSWARAEVGQAVGWYGPDQGARFIASIVGAVVVLFIWNRLVAAHIIGDPGAPR